MSMKLFICSTKLIKVACDMFDLCVKTMQI